MTDRQSVHAGPVVDIIVRAWGFGGRLLTSEARFFTHAVAHPD